MIFLSLSVKSLLYLSVKNLLYLVYVPMTMEGIDKFLVFLRIEFMNFTKLG